MTRDALSLDPWGASVRLTPDPELVEELVRRRGSGPGRRSVGVTDLVDPRAAYWRIVAPVEPSPERRAVLDAGREAHVRIGHLIADARFREIRLQREGIVGQIDLLEDLPPEIKTTRSTPETGEIAERRPSYLDQLGMYCALVGISDARLILVRYEPDGPSDVTVHDGRYRSLEAIWSEMLQRASTLRSALERQDPSGLPRCPWKGRGCEFEASESCDCTGEETPLASTIVAELEGLTANPEVARGLADRLNAPEASAPPVARRFRDLLYPRRAYFERTEPSAPETDGVGVPWRPSSDGLYRELSDLLEGGPAGEMTREPTGSGVPLERIACFRGDPILLKVTRAWSPPPPTRAIGDQPQYYLDLALRCAALERSRGILLVGYERVPDWTQKVKAFRVEFDPLDPVRQVYRDRIRALDAAVRSRDPMALPACPTWMFENCPYRARCACAPASPPSRVNR